MNAPLTSLLALAALALPASSHGAGAVYTQSNDAAGNSILAFDRAQDGALSFRASYPTGGLGLDSGLGSQGAVTLSSDGRWLLAVNAGSDDVSVFRATPAGLFLTDVEPSRGDMPTSVATFHGRVWVLNAGADSNVAGFSLSPSGDLEPLLSDPVALSNAAPAPGQVGVSLDGTQLFVTERATDQIGIFPVLSDGSPGPGSFVPSVGATPFGFGFGPKDTLIVSEAFGGAGDASAVSSYRIGYGSLDVISASVPTTETAACWIVVSKDGRYAYTTNGGSGTVSGYQLDRQSGELTLLDADGVTGDLGAGANPLDAALSVNGHFLYVLSPKTGEIAGFRVGKDGSLWQLSSALGLPGSVYGLAAR